MLLWHDLVRTQDSLSAKKLKWKTAPNLGPDEALDADLGGLAPGAFQASHLIWIVSVHCNIRRATLAIRGSFTHACAAAVGAE